MTTSWRAGPLVRFVAIATVALVAATACGETSKVDPSAKVSISGRVTTPSGEPLADRPVRLATGASGGDALLGVITLGLACTAGICDDTVRSAVTRDDGTYRFVLRGRDTQTSFGNVRTQVLSASAAPAGDQVSGASMAAQFVVQTERVRLPPLELVDPALSVEAASGRAVASWEPSPGAPYTLAFETDSVVPVWQVTTAETGATVDSRVLEGSSGRVVVSGGFDDTIEGSDIHLTWRSPGVGYAAAGAPLSRDAACRYGNARSASLPGTGGDCGLTDGDLFFAETPVARCPGQPSPRRKRACPQPTTATIDMEGAAPVDLVVVRGCSSRCPVEVSANGRRWRAAGAATSPFATVRLPEATVRSVRVGLGVDGLREVSVWGPEAQLEPGLQPVPEAELEVLREPYEAVEPEESGGVPGIVWVGAGALLIALVAMAYRAGRRRGAASQP
ncbi:MAG TPA: hypothetical protein VEV43_08980 [Actinomycetota bacterium]|nr:hypothetical protein [Actinomycetota bacterium]